MLILETKLQSHPFLLQTFLNYKDWNLLFTIKVAFYLILFGTNRIYQLPKYINLLHLNKTITMSLSQSSDSDDHHIHQNNAKTFKRYFHSFIGNGPGIL